MKISNVLGVQALFLLSLSPSAFLALGCTELENVSFEDGNFNCWTTDFTDGNSDGSNRVTVTDANFAVPYGSYMAKIGGGNFENKISRVFNVPIAGKVAFDGDESNEGFNDSGKIRIVESGQVVWEASISDFGGIKENSPWMPFSYSSPTCSSYTLEVISTNDQDDLYDSYVYFDIDPISPGNENAENCGENNGTAQGNGDPHFRTWKDEHFEFHGQCDVVFSKVKDFAGPGKDLDIHLRTSMVRYWSYIKTAAIRIDNEILEVEGSAAKEDGVDKLHYRINYEYRGSLEDGIGGFPVSINPSNDMYTIDLDSKFPGQMIQIKTFKEFVSVKIIGANQESFGNSVGIIGDYKTGKTLARDGHTVLHDFNELGLEWQVLPSDGKLFHEMARPQFPELCYLPEDPRGERTRRLAESDITEEAAEAACAGLKDEFDRKGCIYDILATQDMDMVGAY